MENTMDIPLNAYLICYGPLAVTVLGFILFAVLTDLDARRTYLRRIPGRPPRDESKRLDAETPAGDPVSLLPPDSVMERGAAPAPSKPKAAPAPAAGKQDDLTMLEGIGPRVADALVAAGIDTFAKVASSSIEDFQDALEASGVRFAPAAESWAEQASYAVKGDWEGLVAFQATLISGRYPPTSDE
jgi:predicted flap endonuclease-1-like 5' DNA nuclease